MFFIGKMIKIILILLGLALLAGYYIGDVDGAIDSNSFGIVLSQGCRTMIQNNITSDCPTYEMINTLFPDTSDQKIIGAFGYKDGMYQRLSSNYKNSEGYYNYGYENLMFIDPPVKLWNKLNIITIASSLDKYLLPKNASYNATNHSLTLGHGRYIDSCRTAIIDSKEWIFLTGDTIQHLQNKCTPESTNYNALTTMYMKKVIHDITTSYKYQLAQFFKSAIEKCGTSYCIPTTK